MSVGHSGDGFEGGRGLPLQVADGGIDNAILLQAIETLEKIIATDFVRCSYTEAVDILIKSGKKPAKDPNEEEEVDPDQDAHDSLAGDEPEGGDEKPAEAPPPVEPKAKKGCSIDSDGSTWNGALLLLVLGVGLATRRRD